MHAFGRIVMLSCSPALLLSCSPALLLSCSPALLLSCSPALLLSCSPALLLSHYYPQIKTDANDFISRHPFYLST
ncbi:hypothetical protein C0Z01_10900 [Photobacterium kishitanii]|nr:hypothetical protein C0W42_01670 [Photobacterium kishitanii]PSW69314.1 hypothetical protein C0Z01_10900 [Photobacterium kishitanii]